MGRPSEYSETLEKKICASLRAGSTRTASVAAVGISYPTFLSWMQSNLSFFNAVTRAEADAENKMARVIVTAATEDWRAAESWLKRRRRDDWGDNLSVTSMKDDDLIREARAILERSGSGYTSGGGEPGLEPSRENGN